MRKGEGLKAAPRPLQSRLVHYLLDDGGAMRTARGEAVEEPAQSSRAETASRAEPLPEALRNLRARRLLEGATMDRERSSAMSMANGVGAQVLLGALAPSWRPRC